jgi:large subunit ribosomal protein L25
MSEATLTAQIRTGRGTRPAGRLRREGLVPAVVYGLGGDNVPISVPARELQHILSGGTGANTLITLRLDGDEQLALARQIQREPVKGTLVHVDFVRVRADVAISAEVPVHLVGDAEGVKRGGHLEQLVFSIAVEAKPTDLPPAIEFDVSALEMGDQVHVRDLVAPPGVTITLDGGELVAQVAVPRGVEEPEAEAEEEAGEAAPTAETGAEETGASAE